MTWNIHGGRSLFGAADIPRVIAVVRRHDPDIVALQEIDSRHASARSSFDLLRDSLGQHATQARMIVGPDGDYGHALLSRWPIAQSSLHDISMQRREPRAALEALIDTPSGPLHVVAVHLGLSLRERHRQASKLAALARAVEVPTVMLGDFNDWLWHGSVQWALREVLPGRSRFRTYPAWFPLFRLDRIYCRPASILQRVYCDASARSASDHLPVIADIAFGSGAARAHDACAAATARHTAGRGQGKTGPADLSRSGTSASRAR